MNYGQFAFPLSLALTIATPVFSQTVELQDRLEDERQEELLRERAQETRPGIELAPESVPQVGQEANCYDIQTIQVEGITKLDKTFVEQLVAQYSNTCMGPQAVNALMESINAAYLEKGLITTRAYVPEQDIASGTLIVVVVEGVISGIHYNENEIALPAYPKVSWSFPIDSGDILDLRDIEQGMDQINRVPSANAQMDIAPGDEASCALAKLRVMS